jgi:hypothetical protein
MKLLKELSKTKQNHRRDMNRLPAIKLGTLTPSLSKQSRKLRDLKICINPTSPGNSQLSHLGSHRHNTGIDEKQ